MAGKISCEIFLFNIVIFTRIEAVYLPIPVGDGVVFETIKDVQAQCKKTTHHDGDVISWQKLTGSYQLMEKDVGQAVDFDKMNRLLGV